MELLNPHLSNTFHRQMNLRDITNFTVISNNSHAKLRQPRLQQLQTSQGVNNQQFRFWTDFQENYRRIACAFSSKLTDDKAR